MSNRPESPFVNGQIDPEIAPLVAALADSQTVTLGSCCGHSKEPAYVDLAVKGLPGLRCFVARLNHVREALNKASRGGLEVYLNWRYDVVTGCDFEGTPDWIMLTLTVQADPEGGAPDKRLLVKIARLYTQSDRPVPSRGGGMVCSRGASGGRPGGDCGQTKAQTTRRV